MGHFLLKAAVGAGLFSSVCLVLILAGPVDARDRMGNTVMIVAPDQRATKVYSQPSPTAGVLAIVVHGEVLEALGRKGGYVQVRLPDSKEDGFVLEEHTVPWQPPAKQGPSPMVHLVIALVVLAAVGGGLLYLRAKRAREVERSASLISESIRLGEEFFRSGDYPAAIEEFSKHLKLQAGEVRNPDVYRRLSYCHVKTGDPRAAALCWEKMKALGGLKTTQDYSLGVEIMTALGQEATAAEIYETLLRMEQDDERAYEIHKNLFAIYRRLKKPQKLLEHAIELISTGATEPEIYSNAVHFLIAESATDLAIESNNKEIILRIGQEFLEEKAMGPEAERIYLKCLAFDRTDQRFHRALAEKYKRESNVRKAVGELTILHQLDKERPDEYIEQAAKLYVENSLVSEALAEGNPKVIKKIAQIYLSRSEVTPDAVAVYERLVEMQPNLVGVNKMLSTVYLTKGEPQKYMEKLRLLHKLDGANHDYLNDLARCVIDNDLIEPTLRERNQVLNDRILKHLLKRPSQDEKGLASLEAFRKYEPANVTALGALAKAYEQQGDHARNLEILLTLSHLKPEALEIAEKATSIALEHDLLETVLQKGHRAVLLATAIEIVSRRLDTQTALQILVRALKEYPQEVTIRKYLDTKRDTPEPPADVPETPQRPSQATEPAKPTEVPAVRQKLVPIRQQRKKPPAPPPKADAPISPDSASSAPPPRPTAKQTVKEEPPEGVASKKSATKAPPVHQTVQFTGRPESPALQKQVTTFVSYHEKGQFRVRYDPDELFVPASGGFAYKDLDVVATDGWGLWQLAKEVNTERSVLLRVFRKGLVPDYVMGEFVEEVSRLSFNLIHDGILPIDDVVTGPGHTHGLICSYMPQTLEQVLQAKQRPDLATMTALIEKIAAALAYACSYRGADGKVRRTYHLALQPSQIFLSKDLTNCKITGLGYAHLYRNLMKANQPRWKDPGSNPAFMPPELFATKAGSILERAVDVYSLGVIAYLVVTGDPPFEGPEADDYRFQHIKEFPSPPSLRNPSVPEWLESIILQCLEKSPEKRWNSSVEVYEALRRYTRMSKK